MEFWEARPTGTRRGESRNAGARDGLLAVTERLTRAASLSRKTKCRTHYHGPECKFIRREEFNMSRRIVHGVMAAGAGLLLSCGVALADSDEGDGRQRTATPIKHLIVLIGENWTFDSIYATYQPKKGQTVSNLLSNGIVTASGVPGPHFAKSWQFIINQPYPATYFMDALATSGKTLYRQGPATPSFPSPNVAYIPPA